MSDLEILTISERPEGVHPSHLPLGEPTYTVEVKPETMIETAVRACRRCRCRIEAFRLNRGQIEVVADLRLLEPCRHHSAG